MINSLDDAITHCLEVAKEQDKLATRYEDASGYSRTHIESLKTNESIKCRECAEEHRQLAEWLKALKEIWDSGDCNDCRNGQCEWKPRLGQLVRFNCPHYVGVANNEVNADEEGSESE